MMIDVAHVSDEAFWQVIELSRAPVIASHSSCRIFTPGWERNMDDAMIRALAAAGGVIQINFGSAFLTDAARRQSMGAWDFVRSHLAAEGLVGDHDAASRWFATYWQERVPVATSVADVADHIDHVVRIAGVDHVGFGSDFDGVSQLPHGLEDVRGYPNLIAELLRRGYTEAEIRQICGGNLLRVWEAIRAAAAAG
jgi:membrane dipeptidase